MNRLEQINDILRDLRDLQKNSTKHDSYALSELVYFFEVTKSIPKYISWLLFHAPRLDSERLLEINDLPFSHHERKMHEKLIEMEKQKFPGLIKLQVNGLTDYVLSQSRDLCLASFGSGGMETERQVLKRIMSEGYNKKLVIVGVDYSEVAHSVAQQNLKEFSDKISIINLDQLDVATLRRIVAENKKYTIVLCKNNVFHLDEEFKEKVFDAVFHTLFKHHLTNEEEIRIDQIIARISERYFEYDGYKSWFAMVPQTFVGWNDPAFLNAEIFSNLRFRKRSQIKKHAQGKGILKLHRLGYYLLHSEL